MAVFRKDVYYKSPEDAQVIVNKTLHALKVEPFIEAAFHELNAAEAQKQADSNEERNFFSTKIHEALNNSEVITYKTLQDELKLIVNANFVKVEKFNIQFDDKRFTFEQLGIDKLEMINQLRGNRVSENDAGITFS